MDKDHIKILLIEDDEDDYALVRELLSGLGRADFSLEWVKTYQEGLEELCRGDHDVYLLDYRLGSRDGLELIREATGSGCDKPIIFFTGSGDYEVDMGAMRSGVADYLVKGQLTNDMLERSIRYSIARKKSERELKIYRDRLEDLVKERTGQLETANEKLRLEVAERKLAEEALKESEDELRGLFAAMTDVVLVMDADGYYVKIAPTSSINLYRPPDELLGKKVHEVLPEGDADKILQQIKLALENRQTINFEYALKIESREVWFGSKVSPLTDNTVFWIARDITDRKLAQDELFNSRQMLRSVLDNIPQRVFWKDRNSVYVGCNKPFALDWGYEDPGELVGKTDYEHAAAVIADLYVADDCEVVESGRPKINYEEPQIRPDGSRAWLITSKVPMYDQDGQVIGILGTYADITERKLMEEELAEEATRRRILFDQSRDEIVVLDENGKVYEANRRFAEMLGYSAEEIAQLYVWDWDVNWTQAELLERIRLIDAEGSIFETRHRRKDGTIYDVEISSNGVELAGQKMNFCVHRDISQRKAAEQALQENKSRLELALRSVHMGVWQWDLIKDKRFFDDQVCRLLGIDPAKFTGTADDFFNVVHPDDREVLKAALTQTLGQDVPYETEYRAVWPDGSVHYILTRGKLFRDRIGQPVKVDGLIWDITERKRAEEEKEKLEAELQQAQKLEAIGTLAGGIAHDFNNILQPIIGYTDMELNDLSPSDPVRKSLEQVLKASLRAKDLIRQIMAISRSTQEQQRIPIDISSIIKEALKLLRSSLPTSIEMRQKIRKGVALAEPTQIHQVLMNLCTNAAHAMADKGILKIRLSPVDLSETDLARQRIVDLKPGPYLKLSVSDTGAGMDASTMEHIFDPYFTTKEVGKGSGLGLAVVHSIVKRHEGAITVLSEPGKGTIFSVYFPRVDIQPEATMQVDDTLQRGSERILLVDDESNVMEMATRILERLGYKVTSQTDSASALEIFWSNPDEFDLLITDYTMPKLTGLDFAREARLIRPDMPILLCTGFSEKITSERMKELGMGLLMKPYGMREISEEVRKILDERKVG